VLGGANGPSSPAASMSMAVELLKDRIGATTANGFRWGSRSALVAAVSHFSELKIDLEVLKSGRSADLIEDEANALRTWVHTASDLLASYVPSSVACNPPDGTGGGGGSGGCLCS
jgi:hypothetical protein